MGIGRQAIAVYSDEKVWKRSEEDFLALKKTGKSLSPERKVVTLRPQIKFIHFNQ